MWCDIEGHKRFECVFLITNWFWGGMTQLIVRQMISEPRSWVQITRVLLWGRDCWGTIIWLPTITLKISLCGVILKVIKDLSVFFSLPIDFEVEWHSSRSDKWYQSQGHKFELRECYCEGRIVGGAIIWLPTTTLKIGLCGVVSKVIKDWVCLPHH